MTTPVTYAFLDFEYATDPVLKDTHIIQVGFIITQQNGKIQKRYKTLVNIDYKAIVSITHQSERFGYVGVKDVHIPLGQPTDVHAQRKMTDAYKKGYAQLTKQPLVTTTYKDKLQLNQYMSLCKNKKYKKPRKSTYTYK